MIFKGVTNISLLLPHEILFLLSHVQSFLLCFPLFLPSYSPLPLPNALGMPMATEVFKCAKTHTVEKMSAINGSIRSNVAWNTSIVKAFFKSINW